MQATMRIPVTGPVVQGWGAPTEAGPASGVVYEPAGHMPVVAPCAGQVLFAGPFRSYRHLVILDCGAGTRVVLGGMDRLGVAAGRRVRAGAAIGLMPQDHPALYVELRRGDRPVDPLPYLRGKG